MTIFWVVCGFGEVLCRRGDGWGMWLVIEEL